MRASRGESLPRGRAVRAWLLAHAAAACAPADAPARPNVLLIVADDLGWGDVAAFGGRLPTPSIDALARGGVRLTDGYATASVCNPSRAGLLSGRYQERFGQELNSPEVPPDGAPIGCLPASVPTLAEALKAAGYATGAVGKWQLGMDEAHHPLARGFDAFFGYANRTDYVDPDWPGVHAVADSAGPFSDPLLSGREPVELADYLTAEQGRAAQRFIEDHRREPFFLYVSFTAPHTPLQVTQEYYDRHPELEDEVERICAGMIAALDDAVGTILRALAESGVEERTLVFFLSDNGAEAGTDVALRRNAPFAGHKGTLYEGGLRVPFAVRWPARLAGGETYAHPISALDVCATALAAAGAAERAPGLDGVDLVPFLCGERTGAPHDGLFWRAGPNAAARAGPWKLLRTGDGRRRLFDLLRDPAEERDLAAQLPGKAAELERALEAWSAEMAPPQRSLRTAETAQGGDAIEWHL